MMDIKEVKVTFQCTVATYHPTLLKDYMNVMLSEFNNAVNKALNNPANNVLIGHTRVMLEGENAEPNNN